MRYRLPATGNDAKLTVLTAPSGTMNTSATSRRCPATGSQTRARRRPPASRYDCSVLAGVLTAARQLAIAVSTAAADPSGTATIDAASARATNAMYDGVTRAAV